MNQANEKTLEFIKQAKLIHGDKYDYSKSVYVNNKTKLEIYCPKHDLIFNQTPGHHINKKCRCPKCGRESGNFKQTKQIDTFIKDAKAIHGDIYDYNKSVYINKYTNLIITCKIHGDFEQTPSTHLRSGCKYGCPKCGHVKIGNFRRLSLEEFINKSKSIHGETKFDYSKVIYINDKTNIKLICRECDVEFETMPGNHVRGAGGCPCCTSSRGENDVRNFLIKNNIKFEEQKMFDGCKYKALLKFDFYLPDHNACIEFQGRQHFEPISYFGGEDGFKLIKERDKAKVKYCVDNNIKLHCITDTQYSTLKALV